MRGLLQQVKLLPPDLPLCAWASFNSRCYETCVANQHMAPRAAACTCCLTVVGGLLSPAVPATMVGGGLLDSFDYLTECCCRTGLQSNYSTATTALADGVAAMVRNRYRNNVPTGVSAFPPELFCLRAHLRSYRPLSKCLSLTTADGTNINSVIIVHTGLDGNIEKSNACSSTRSVPTRRCFSVLRLASWQLPCLRKHSLLQLAHLCS